MRIFIICPVRGITEEEQSAIETYTRNMESEGHRVHWPPRDTNQEDSVGYRICADNYNAIIDADEIHVWWNINSQGSLFDLGMAFALQKKIHLINRDSIKATETKSFTNVLLYLHDMRHV